MDILQVVQEFILFIYYLIAQLVLYVKSNISSSRSEICEKDTVLVVGACGFVGSELCYLLSARGCRMILIDKDSDSLKQVSEDVTLTDPNKVKAFCQDITNFKKVSKLLENLIASKIIPNIIIFNAAINHAVKCSQLETDDFMQVVNNNVTSFVNIMTFLLPHISNLKARVAVVSSTLSYSNAFNCAAYSASKAALNSYTQAMQLEFSDICFSIIYPAKIKTPLFQSFKYKYIPQYILDDLDPNYVAENIIWMIENRVNRIYLPFYLQYLTFFPPRFTNFILSKFYENKI